MPQLSPLTFAPAAAVPAMPAGVPLPPGMIAAPFAPSAPVASPDDTVQTREAFRTKADSIEIEMDENAKRASLSLRAAGDSRESRESYPPPPSTGELLARAAALGPARMTWESIVLPADPILDEKRQPHVAERRARLTRFVKIGLGACLAMCVVAVGATAMSGDNTSEKTPASAAIGKNVASKGVVPVEPLEGTKHAKVVRRVAPAVTTAAFVRPKRR